MLSIVTNTTVTFTRLSYNICSGYEIYAIEKVAGADVTHLVETIDNPKVPNLVPERATLDWNARQRWELPRDVLALASDSINVYLNNVQVNTNNYTFSSEFRTLLIHTKLGPNDLIEIEYNVDRIERHYPSVNNVRYKVIPIFNQSHKLGQHIVL